MQELNFPTYRVQIKDNSGRQLIFDSIRKKYVALTPEEWVRQHLVNYLVTEKNYPSTLISVEMPLKYARLDKRSDVVVFDRNGNALMIAECKAHTVNITQKVFEQISIYQMGVSATCLMVTNGLKHYCMKTASGNQSACFLPEIPDYQTLLTLI